ncbi:MAG: hypothetical protein ABI377_04225 [Devosia sp.]
MEIKISITDGGGTDVQYTPTGQRSPEAAAAATPGQATPAAAATLGQATPAAAAADLKAAFSGGLNAGAAPADLAAPGAKGAPMPFITAVDDGSPVHAGAQTDDMSAGAAPSR